MTLGVFPDEKLLMYQFFKNHYFRLRDIFFTLEFYLNERKKRNSVKKIIKNFCENKPRHKIIKKIGFYVYCRTHVDHLEPIYKHLNNDLFEIVLSDDFDFKDSLIQEGYKVSTSYEIILSEYKFKCLVSLYMQLPSWTSDCDIKHNSKFDANAFFELLSSKNIRMVYSIGALPWNKGGTMLNYDEIFVCGPYEENIYNKKFNSKIEIKQVGYPKFDSFVNNEKNGFKNDFKFDRKKKTVLWLPTKMVFVPLINMWML